MSYFLWIEDFASQTGGEDIAHYVLGGIIEPSKLLGDKKKLKRDLKSEGVYIELNFGDGLDIIQNKLADIDYIILDIDLPAYSGSEPNSNVLNLLEKWHGYKRDDEESLGASAKKLQEIAGYHLYTELVFNLGFPRSHILFCSNHGDDVKSTTEAFYKAKIELPPIYKKENKEEVQAWVKSRYENPYARLRRGIVEGCRYLKTLSEDKLRFNDFIKESERQVSLEDIRDYFGVLENFLPLREPSDKAALYKLFIRTLAHEWEAADFIKGEAWIMKSTRNWITHNSTLFNVLDEKMLAYLFIINMRVMFSFDEAVQPYEKILLDLFKEDALPVVVFKNQTDSKLFPLSKAYLDLKNLVLDERQEKNNNVQDGFYFNELANNIQQSNSSFKNDKQLFTKLLYQMFWLTTSNPFISTGNRRNLLEIKFWGFNYAEKPYVFELARHIYNRSFL